MGFAQREFHRHFPRSAVEGHGDRIARLMPVHDLGNILWIGHPVFVDGDNQIAAQVNRRIPR